MYVTSILAKVRLGNTRLKCKPRCHPELNRSSSFSAGLLCSRRLGPQGPIPKLQALLSLRGRENELVSAARNQTEIKLKSNYCWPNYGFLAVAPPRSDFGLASLDEDICRAARVFYLEGRQAFCACSAVPSRKFAASKNPLVNHFPYAWNL